MTRRYGFPLRMLVVTGIATAALAGCGMMSRSNTVAFSGAMNAASEVPPNMTRGSGHMFATDGKARAIAGAAVDAGHDRQVDPQLRPFFYLPFMHSEVLADQERSVALNADLDANTQRFARLHRDLIARFGRFPHRNRLLGRGTTPEEQAYLDGGGFSG